GGAGWFIAGAVVIALVIVAFVIGGSSGTGPVVPDNTNVDVEMIDPSGATAGDVLVPGNPEGAPAGIEGSEANPVPDASGPDAVPAPETAN
ncbi:MAG: hypothetical protein WBN04_21615, partial [Paracoccaceae bacterium]